MPDLDAFSLLDIKKRNKRSHGKRKNGNFKRKHKTVLSLFDLNILCNSGCHQMLSKLASLSVSSLRKLDDEAITFLLDFDQNFIDKLLVFRWELIVLLLLQICFFFVMRETS